MRQRLWKIQAAALPHMTLGNRTLAALESLQSSTKLSVVIAACEHLGDSSDNRTLQHLCASALPIAAGRTEQCLLPVHRRGDPALQRVLRDGRDRGCDLHNPPAAAVLQPLDATHGAAQTRAERAVQPLGLQVGDLSAAA